MLPVTLLLLARMLQGDTKWYNKQTLLTISKVSSNNYISFHYSYEEKLNIPI